MRSLRRGLESGREAGLKYVYAGNIPGESENTICPVCGEVLIERLGYQDNEKFRDRWALPQMRLHWQAYLASVIMVLTKLLSI